MCGIAGAIGPVQPNQARVTAALALMHNRGPDASGVHHSQLGRDTVTLLHTRLSIVDLDPRANQPFVDGNSVLVFNGEIYNHREIRRELEDAGVRFRTQSDTEVIIKAYQRWGEACVDRFEGMWALALLDTSRGVLWLCRDRFGEKPLFTWRVGETLYFASEIKALAALAGQAPQPDPAQIRRYLVNGYKSLNKRNRSFFRDVQPFPAACSSLLKSPDLPRPKPYWELKYSPRAMSADEAVAGVRECLTRALSLRLRADVPVAFCLSGGIDSATLVSLAVKEMGQDAHTFSIIDEDERYDESDNINSVIKDLGCDNHQTHTSPTHFFGRMEQLVAYHDAPVATISYYVHSFLSEAISHAGYRVALSGTGADEIFTGYYDHYNMWLAEMATQPDFGSLVSDWRESYGAHVTNPFLQDPLAFVKEPDQRDHIYLNRERFAEMVIPPNREGFWEENFDPTLLRRRMMNELFREVVPVLLAGDDLNSMKFSVENRSPYLDRNLVEFVYTVPAEHLIKNGFPKWLLRSAGKGLLTNQVRLDRRKRGFNASILSFLDPHNKETQALLLDDSPIFEIVDRSKFQEFLETDLIDAASAKFLFSFISSKIFLDRVSTDRLHEQQHDILDRVHALN